MGQTDLLEDLCGMAGLNGDVDDIEVGSDYPYAEEIRGRADRG